jgi:glycosyltransferase involved in cell wall biosynthesis
MKRICLISGAHLSSNPRIIKEADALHAHGYTLQVLTTQSVPLVVKFDDELRKVKPWPVYELKVHEMGLLKRAKYRLQRKMAQQAVLRGECSVDTFGRAFAPWSDFHLKEIVKFKPDLIIAHTLPSLAVAMLASQKMQIPYAFDMEDYHPGEQAGTVEEISNQLALRLLREGLPQARYLTAASPLIASEAEKEFRLSGIKTILNCFPLVKLSQSTRAEGDVALYWFSQVLGHDRGLQDIMKACGKLRGSFSLHLRGYLDGPTRQKIALQIATLNLEEKCHFLPWCSPAELLKLTQQYDVGLALENPQILNRDICITNKILSYPNAGLAIAASRTRGQEWVMNQSPEMGFLYETGNIDALSEELQYWIDHREALKKAKQEARRAAEERFCWEKEEPKFLEVVGKVLK